MLVRFDYPGKLTGWLRGTIWTTDRNRADIFSGREIAQEHIAKALQFLPKSAKKYITIVEE